MFFYHFRYLILDFQILATRSWLSWLPDPGFQIVASRSWLPDPGFQILATVLAIWNYVELPGSIWSYLELSGAFWSYLELRGAT